VGPSHHDMARPRVTSGGEGLEIRSVAKKKYIKGKVNPVLFLN
jgi:hypothetical protein